MKTRILWLMLSYLLILFFMGISLAEDLESACYDEYNVCTAYCDKQYSTDEYDIWNHWRPESNITRGKRNVCKTRCLSSQNSCIRRKRALEEEQKVQEELESQPVVAPPLRYRNLGEEQETQEDTTTEYPSSPSDSNIYTWTDENGVVHITNDKDSIPPEYREQIEKGTNKEAIEIIKDKNDTKSKSTDKKTK